MMTPSAGLHFLSLTASLFGVSVALATAWGVHIRKRDKLWSPVDLPEGSYFLLFLCACIALLTHKHAGPVLDANFRGEAHAIAVCLHVVALLLAGLHVLMGAHAFIGNAFLYGDRHRNRGH